jgi:Fe-S-cluster containining protein
VSTHLICPQQHTWPASQHPSVCPVCGATGRLIGAAENLNARLRLSIGGCDLRLQVTVPAGPTRPRVLLPLCQSLTDVVVEEAVKEVAAEGKTISCQKGCGSCCRQLAPITPAEAHALGELVEGLPEPRRSAVRARFAEARQRLEDAGLLEALQNDLGKSKEELRQLGLEYFAQSVACPFLEDESCSIHPHRPLACREYLVTSPAEHCAHPTADTVRCVPIPVKLGHALTHLDGPASRPVWVPLILVLDWVEKHPEPAPQRTGPELLQALLRQLAGPTPDSAAGPE